MKSFKKIAACLMAGVIMMSALVTASSAESIEKSAKEIESGKTYSATIAMYSKDYADEAVYKMNVSEAGKIKVSTAFYRTSVGFTLYDENGKAVKYNKDDINVKVGSFWSYSTSGFDLLWAESMEKGTATITYTVEKKGIYYLKVDCGAHTTKGKVSIAATFPSATETKTDETPYFSLTLAKGDTLSLGTTIDGATWSSADKTIATVSKKGKITAKKKGTVFITAKVNNVKLKIQIKVTE